MKKKKAKKRGYLSIIVIALGAFVISMLCALLQPVQIFELKYHDQLFEWRDSSDVADSPIVLVAISQQADDEIPEKWPWSTDIYTRLIENLNESGAKTIVFDVVFDQKDTEYDSLFAEALHSYGNVILAGEVERVETGMSIEYRKVFPNEVLLQANPNQPGLVKMSPDIDEGIRYYKFGNLIDGVPYYMLGIEAIREYKNLSSEDIESLDTDPEKSTFDVGPYQIKRDVANGFIINYYGPEGMFPQYSLDLIIDDSTYTTVTEAEAFEINSFDDPDFGLIHKDIFKDKIVIVGSTMPTLGDFHVTPFALGDRPRPGFEIHAHAIQTILDGNYITRVSDWFSVAVMLFFCFLTPLVTRLFNYTGGIIITLILIGGYVGATYFAFIEMHLIMMLTGPVLALVISQIGMISYEYYIEQREKRRIKGMFSSYVSPNLVEQMVASGEEPQLGGEEKYMTAFFSDIQSFSTFSEQLGANQLVVLINEYLNAMTQILNNHGGTLDKYIGDAIVGFFGAPVALEKHALEACIVSQLMQKKQAQLRKKWAKEDWPDIVANMQTRIGMNTGKMVTGNMGSLRRFNYTMMGDNVNLAARCESGAKQYGVYTMVTQSTKKEAEKFGDDCIFRLLDNIVVKGRSQPVKVYEVADLKSDAGQNLFDCIGLYEKGMEFYFNQEWDKAIQSFEHSLVLEVHSKNPSNIFIERCKMMKEDPPDKDWNGVFVMKTK